MWVDNVQSDCNARWSRWTRALILTPSMMLPSPSSTCNSHHLVPSKSSSALPSSISLTNSPLMTIYLAFVSFFALYFVIELLAVVSTLTWFNAPPLHVGTTTVIYPPDTPLHRRFMRSLGPDVDAEWLPILRNGSIATIMNADSVLSSTITASPTNNPFIQLESLVTVADIMAIIMAPCTTIVSDGAGRQVVGHIHRWQTSRRQANGDLLVVSQRMACSFNDV
jgi:hypothetical protein